MTRAPNIAPLRGLSPIAFIVSDSAAFSSGAYIPVCGGDVMPCVSRQILDLRIASTTLLRGFGKMV